MYSLVSSVLRYCKVRFGSADAVKGAHQSPQPQPEELKGFTLTVLLLVFFRKRLGVNWGHTLQAGLPYVLVQRTLDRLTWRRLTKRSTHTAVEIRTGGYRKGEVLCAALMELRQLEEPNGLPFSGEDLTVHRN